MSIQNEDRQLLVVLFDVNPLWWDIKTQKGLPNITKCLDCILAFINSYRMLRHDNQVAVIASHSTRSEFLYPNPNDGSDDHDDSYLNDDNKKISSVISSNFKRVMDQACHDSNIQSDSLIAGSIAMALCYIHKIINQQKVRRKVNSRILIIKASEDDASQYMSLMNCIFAAQKDSVVVDACVLGESGGLLQQVCDMTEGLYLQVPQEHALLQYLLTAFIVEPNLRKESLILSLKRKCSDMEGGSNEMSSTNVDYRAACFCHRQLIETGFVCSVCLSIFCQFSPICSTCETAFKPPMGALPKARKKRKANQQSAAAVAQITNMM